MSNRPWPTTLALAGVVALTGGACVLGDVFGSDRLEQVTLIYDGPTGNLAPGSRQAFSVAVVVGGSIVRNARVGLSMLQYDSVAALNAGQDTIVALNIQGVGTDTLLARFKSSMLVDTVIELRQPIRVQGGGP